MELEIIEENEYWMILCGSVREGHNVGLIVKKIRQLNVLARDH